MTNSQVDVPSILGFDPFAPEFHADPYAHYRELRAAGPLHRTPGGLWLSPSFEVCSQIFRDPRFGHGTADDEGAAGLRARRIPRRVRSFLVLDPPEHTRLRRLVSRAFTARLIERLRPRVASIVDELMAGLHGEVDLISTLAHPADELGARDQARAEFGEYFRDLAALRRKSPGDDLLSGLVAIEELSEADLLATCILLLVAGHETTVNLIANGTLALLRSPDQLAWFRDNLDSAPAAIEELLRYDPPVQLSARTALEDAEVAGQRIKAGEPVMLLLGAANRDPEVFADPDRLDLTRWLTEAPRHLAFGQGIHFCLGAPRCPCECDLRSGRRWPGARRAARRGGRASRCGSARRG
jgi:cytochrome P450